MKASENTLKWAMRLYPPLLLQRIWVQKVHLGFRGINIKINRCLFTLNFGRSIFGGTIYSACDPFYALLFGQILRNEGIDVTVWLKSANIKFLKPGRTDLYYTLLISEEMVRELKSNLMKSGVHVQTYPIKIYSKTGDLYAIAENEIYIRKQ